MRKGDPAYPSPPSARCSSDGARNCTSRRCSTGQGTLREKIQWYLASELRDRIRDPACGLPSSIGVARKQYAVEPRKYEGQLLHQLPPVRTRLGDVYASST